MVAVRLGTQTAGSVIGPASFRGVIGFTRACGQFPTIGINQLALSLDTRGVFTRDLTDLPLVLKVFGGNAWSLPAADLPPRIASCRTEQWPLAPPDAQRVLVESAEALRTAGARIEEIELSAAFHGLHDVQKLVMAVEMTEALRHERERHADQLGTELLQIFKEGKACSAERYHLALGRALECRQQIEAIFARFYGLLTPSARG